MLYVILEFGEEKLSVELGHPETKATGARANLGHPNF